MVTTLKIKKFYKKVTSFSSAHSLQFDEMKSKQYVNHSIQADSKYFKI